MNQPNQPGWLVRGLGTRDYRGGSREKSSSVNGAGGVISIEILRSEISARKSGKSASLTPSFRW